MNASGHLFLLPNGSAVRWAEIPEWPVESLVDALRHELDAGARLCAWFGVPEAKEVRLVAVLGYDAANSLGVARTTPFVGKFPSLTATHAQAHAFEREIHEQHGLVPEGHPWLKPLRQSTGDAPLHAEFFRVEGREIHEVGVGPVHAGIIEPGHFRFQCAGEEVWHLETAHGYQHRGVEDAMPRGHRAAQCQIEAVSGDATIAHATAHASVMEALAGTEAPLRAQWLRAVALELERLANHTGDLGALANDVAFLPTSAACGKLRGDLLNLTALICGNRFGRHFVRPGGCHYDLEPERLTQLGERLEAALAEVERAAEWLWDAASVRARFESTGTILPARATEIGLVGPTARACGLVHDVRYDHPAGWHRFAQAPVAVWPGGDVLARARVRGLEVQHSGQFLREQLTAPADGEIRLKLAPSAPETLAVALVEGWRGEVCHVAITDRAGQVQRYKIVDPSFHNWLGVALALRGQAISDFPLCNKSFNLSYSGFDL